MYYFSLLQVRSPMSVSWAKIKVVAGLCYFSGGSWEGFVSLLICFGRVQFLAVLGLRFWFSCWLVDEHQTTPIFYHCVSLTDLSAFLLCFQRLMWLDWVHTDNSVSSPDPKISITGAKFLLPDKVTQSRAPRTSDVVIFSRPPSCYINHDHPYPAKPSPDTELPSSLRSEKRTLDPQNCEEQPTIF